MATALRPVGHEERLTLVGHLEELRTRLIICVAAIAVTFSVCYWQNDRVLEILNKPLETKEQKVEFKDIEIVNALLTATDAATRE